MHIFQHLGDGKYRREPKQQALGTTVYHSIYTLQLRRTLASFWGQVIDAWLTIPLDAMSAHPSPVVSGSVEKFDDL